MSVKCTALTQKGTPCTRKSKDGIFCGMHLKNTNKSILLDFERENTIEDLKRIKEEYEKVKSI